MASPRRVAIVGFGNLGSYLAKEVQRTDGLELAWVWNRSAEKLEAAEDIDDDLILRDLDAFDQRQADLIVEVAHPTIAAAFAARFVAVADFMCGSPSALADAGVESALRQAASAGPHGCYIPSGALWGAPDIQKMADRGTLRGLRVTMAKEPYSLRLNGAAKQALDAYIASDETAPCKLFDGPIRQLCPMAPFNVNTMACAALAGHTLGFDRGIGCLIADKSLDAHVIDIEITGPGAPDAAPFSVTTRRYNPSKKGQVTGNATFASFASSMHRARGLGKGMHFV